MPNVYFDKIKKKVGDTVETFLCKDTEAREDIDDILSAIDDQWNVGQSTVLYVSKENSRFTTINQAIAYGRTYIGNMDSRIVIVISTGMYLEYIDLDNNPGFDFYGIGNVTVRSNVAWRLSTLRCSNSITVHNINFENFYTPGDDEHAGYGLHADPITGSQRYFNCTFYSDNNSAVGIGMGNNGQANFYNCTFRGASGGIYAHNNTTNGTVGQWLRFYNCIIESHDGSNCIRIDDAATLANPSASSVMGMVFVNCVGNNNGVTYKYGSPAQVLSYIPANSANYNIFLYEESANNSLIALDPIRQKETITIQFNSMGDNEWYIPVQDAYKYTWSITTFKYREYTSGSGWGSWTDVATRTVRVTADNPNAIYVFLGGTATLAPGSRAFYAILDGVPRKTFTLPVTIH